MAIVCCNDDSHSVGACLEGYETLSGGGRFRTGPSGANTLDKLVNELPGAEMVVACGGAGCQEAAKYYGRVKRVECVHVPTTVSNNAAVATLDTVLADEIRHISFGNPPKAVLIDYDIIQQANPFVNRCGLGEHLCTHTGLFDWRLCSSKGLGLPWNHTVAREMARLEMRALVQSCGSSMAVRGGGVCPERTFARPTTKNLVEAAARERRASPRPSSQICRRTLATVH
jgi:glycerol dehydrogenase-like iron-containing ADH family enzyme